LFLAERFLIFVKILKALCLFFFQTFMINLVLTKPSGPKRHAVAFTAPIFAGFCVKHTDLSGGGGADGTGLHNRAIVRSRQKYGRLFGNCRPHRPLSVFYLK
jgi:hypothetical protein